MQRDVNSWQLFLQQGYELEIEMVSRGFETFPGGGSVAELEWVCVVCLWPWGGRRGGPQTLRRGQARAA